MRNEYKFELISEYKPSGDQPKAIEELVRGINENKKEQVLLGATGTGKTFTISNVIKEVNKPTLVLAHNKTLAGQLYAEFKEFFPNNAVEYFVSYYDYYQPEAYVAHRDMYIEKDARINDEIDKLRHKATSALMERNDVIIIASVSCIYGLGDPDDYENLRINLRIGTELNRDELLRKLVEIQYDRADFDFGRGTFRVRGDVVEVMPSTLERNAIRIEFFGDEIERIREIDSLTGEILLEREHVIFFPASHFVTTNEKLEEAIVRIEKELEVRYKEFIDDGRLLQAERIKTRTIYDIDMLKNTGFCTGVENYSRHLSLRNEGDTPATLLDFFPEDWLLVVDESHVTLPQVRGMYNGDRARKMNLVEHGFRLPSALDNRPLRFEEFENKINQAVYISATPAEYEINQASGIVTEQIIRPTGLLDPNVYVRKTEGQIDDLIGEINARIEKNERVLITTLTIKMSEDLTDYLREVGLKVAYLHSEIKTLERIEIIRDLRLGEYDVLVGINLLREGLDIPEVSLVAILDADKQGFLRSERSLIQTMGRAARNADGTVILYADKISNAMDVAMKETARRRQIQEEYNKKHGITPQTIKKEVRDLIKIGAKVDKAEAGGISLKKANKKELQKMLEQLKADMKTAAKDLDFERAASLRDVIYEIESEYKV